MEADEEERRGQRRKRQYTDEQKAAKVENRRKNRQRQASERLDLEERLERANSKIMKLEEALAAMAAELEAKNNQLKDVLEAKRLSNKKNRKLNRANQQLMLVVEESRREEARRELEWVREKEEMKEELAAGEVNKQIVMNVQELLGALPKMSPYRLSLFHYLIKNMARSTALNLFNTSSSTYQRARQLQDIPLLQMKYKPFTKKKRIREERIQLAREIIDRHAPIQSGHDHHLKLEDDSKFYANYVQDAKELQPTLKPLSKTYFIYKVLYTQKVRNLKNPEFCPWCKALEKLDMCGPLDYLQTKKRAKCLRHQELRKKQTLAYLELKKKIASGITDEAIVIKDFSQFKLEKGFVQVLIIVIYSYDPDPANELHLRRQYLDYVGDEGVTNDVNFVAGVWQNLMTRDYFTGIRTIHIWSDGGPHHFRVSANMWIFAQLQQHFPSFLFIYNFFIAYHGHSVCDASASHGKKRVQTVRRNEKRSIDSSRILIDTLNTLNNHVSTAAMALDAPRLKVETFDGIKSLNCWICIPPLYLYAWDSTSTGGPPTKVFEIPKHIIDTMPVLF